MANKGSERKKGTKRRGGNHICYYCQKGLSKGRINKGKHTCFPCEEKHSQ